MPHKNVRKARFPQHVPVLVRLPLVCKVWLEAQAEKEAASQNALIVAAICEKMSREERARP